MIANKDSTQPDADVQLPNSKRIYVSGKTRADVNVPFREITLAPTKSLNGETEVNEPVSVYDTSGPWTDPDFHGDVMEGLPPLRTKWIRDRADVEEIDGRKVQPIDDGWLSDKHAATAAKRSTPLNREQALNVQRPMKAVAMKIRHWSFVIRHSARVSRSAPSAANA